MPFHCSVKHISVLLRRTIMFWRCVMWKQRRAPSAWLRNSCKSIRHSVEPWAGRDRIRSTCFLCKAFKVITKWTLPASRRVIRFIGVDIIIPTRSSTLPSLYSSNLVGLARVAGLRTRVQLPVPVPWRPRAARDTCWHRNAAHYLGS